MTFVAQFVRRKSQLARSFLCPTGVWQPLFSQLAIVPYPRREKCGKATRCRAFGAYAPSSTRRAGGVAKVLIDQTGRDRK